MNPIPLSINRRAFLNSSLALAASGLLRSSHAARINPPALFENPEGGYRILPSGSVFAGGVIPMEGHEIVHALVNPWIPLKDSWAFIENHLKTLARPVKALCGMELRTPQQLTFEGFRAFNTPYVEQLQKWDLLVGRYNAICRTNVVPARNAPESPMVHAFSYSIPSDNKGATFCLSGTADLDPRGKPVAEGDLSQAGMKKRLQYCVDVLTDRLAEIELDWSAVTHIDLCFAQDVPGLWESMVIPGLKPEIARDVRMHHARPPLIGTEIELECRGVRQEIILSGG